MKIGKEKAIQYSEFKVDFESKEYCMLKEYGKKEILKDDNALINYAINKILADYIQRNQVKSKKRPKK